MVCQVPSGSFRTEVETNSLESDFYHSTPSLWNFLGLWPPHLVSLAAVLRDDTKNGCEGD